MREPATSLVDACANLTNDQFAADLEDVLDRAQAAGVAHVFMPGSSLANSLLALDLADRLNQRSPPIVAATAAGVHPWHASEEVNATLRADLERLLDTHTRIGVIGECGLDYSPRCPAPRAAQLACFETQLRVACERDMPVFLHCRDAHEDFVRVLRAAAPAALRGVVHCFDGDARQALAYTAELGLHIGLCGSALGTAAVAKAVAHAIKSGSVPLASLVIETDAPYLTPRVRGVARAGRNEPQNLRLIAEHLAALYGVDVAELATRTSLNARALLFGR